MRKTVQTGASIVCSLLAISLLVFLLTLLFNSNLWLRNDVFVFILLIIFCFGALALIMARKYYHFAENVQHLWMLGFFLYLFFLGYLLFFSKEFARDRVDMSYSNDYLYYLKIQWTYAVNLKPFSSIHDMISILDTSYRQYSFINLAGNFVAFMPFAVFLPALMKKLNWKRFFLMMSVLIISVEIMQFLTFTGSMDIDDYILNILGAMLAYGFFSLPMIRNLLCIEKRN